MQSLFLFIVTLMSFIWERMRQIWIPTSAARLAEAERRVLSVVRFPFEQNQVPIGDNLTINTIYTHNPNAKTLSKRSPLVLLHGFGAGIGFWLLNLDAFAEQNEHVYAIDMLGCGRSSRPRFSAKTTAEAERFFVDALEKWRIHLNIDRMILLGHSFGAYIGASYAMQFPTRVSHLILASPVGVPVQPAVEKEGRASRIPLRWRIARRVIKFLWHRGYTPQSVVRLIGPWGPKPVSGYVMRRFLIGPAADEEAAPTTTEAGLETSAAIADRIDQGRLKLPKRDVADYLYHLCAQPGSGEYALPRVLNTNVFAYDPLENRMGDSEISRATFLYGDHDWMDESAGRRTVRSLNNRINAGDSARLIVIPNAGHQMMIDNPDGFHRAVQDALRDHRE